MSDYDADEYASFDLRRDPASRRQGEPAGADSDEDFDDEADDDIEDDDDDFDEPEDATDDDIDLVVAVYREDGNPIARALDKDLANDLEELILALRRLPGDGGALGLVSLVGELLVLVRVRGRMVQTVVSDGAASADWPIARDVADYLNEPEVEDPDEFEPIGDLSILADLGIRDFELEAYLTELEDEADSVEVVQALADRTGFGAGVRRVIETDFA